jgi:filamentous hemagglutinin
MPAQDSPPVGAPERMPPVSNQNIQSRANGFPNQRIPAADGRWTGEVGNSGWMSSKPEVRAITKGEPVPFKDGYPDFSKWKVAEVEIPRVTGQYKADFKAADEIFARQRGWLKPNGEPNVSASERYRKSQDLTWHHVENSNRLELVPKALHKPVPHTGSASQARNGELP